MAEIIQVLKTEIPEINADAYVVPTDKYFSEIVGNNSYLFELAGKEFKSQLNKFQQQLEDVVFFTEGYDAPVKYLIHLIGPTSEMKENEKENLLRECYRKAFGEALKRGIKSIALPQLGESIYGITLEKKAVIAVEEAKKYESDNRFEKIIFACRTEYGFDLYNVLKRINKDLLPYFLKLATTQQTVIAKSSKKLSSIIHKREILNQKLEKARHEIETQQNEILDSISYASRIQQAMLPLHEELGFIIQDYFILNKPKDKVSGDFYWIASKENDRILIIAAADCTGHGVPGAFMSALAMSALNEIVNNQRVYQSDEILNLLREAIIKSLHQTGQQGEQKDGLDISLCTIDLDNNNISFSGANNPLYFVTKSNSPSSTNLQRHLGKEMRSYKIYQENEYDLLEIKGDKMPVAINSQMETFTENLSKYRIKRKIYLAKQTELYPFTKTSLNYQPGDTIYLFSDGYSDQFGGPEGKKFLAKRFRKLLLSIQEKSLSDQCAVLDSEIELWKDVTEQVDDILVMGLKL